MRESLRNIGAVCDKHAPKPGGFVGKNPKIFIGKHVKLGFPAKYNGKELKEHMWVKVNAYNEDTKELEGTLDNDPVYDVGIECGDEVAFTVDEIEDVT